MKGGNMSTTSDKESQNFYRAAILVIKHGSEILRKILEMHCENKWISFEELMSKYDHVIFHMWQKDGCCQCSSKKAMYTSGHMLKSQFESMFARKRTRHKCRNSVKSFHKLCSCIYSLKPGLLPRSLDIPVLTCVLLHIKEFNLSPEVSQAVRDTRRLRNEVFAHAKSAKMDKRIFDVTWKQARNAALALANEISVYIQERLSNQINCLLEEPVSLYTSLDVFGIIRHGNDRELAVLQDLKRVKDMIAEGRQGELAPTFDVVMELVCSTLGFSDPLLQEIQNLKFLLLDEKTKDVIRKLEGPLLNQMLAFRSQIKTNVQEANENICRQDTGTEDDAAGFRFHKCGENVFISDDRRHAQWRQAYTAGFIFTHRPFDKLEHVTVHVNGSGQIAIGIIQIDPENYAENLHELIQDSEFKTCININLSKSSKEIVVNLGSVNDEGKLLMAEQFKEYSIEVDRNRPVWLVCYMKFGDVRLQMTPGIGKVLKYHEVKGHNIQCTDGNKRRVKLLHENIDAVCRLNHRIFCGEEVTLYVKPLRDAAGGSCPCHLTLGLTTEGLRSGSLSDNDPFTSASRTWSMLQHFDKTICAGKIIISISLSGCITIISSKGVSNEVYLNERENKLGVTLFLELFQCAVEIAAYRVKTK